MTTARLMSASSDVEALRLVPGGVQQWEDGRRDTNLPMHNEVWYFDAAMDDGTTVVVGFRPKMPAGMGQETSSPNLNVNITTPGGQEYVDMIQVDPAGCEMSTERCHVVYGPHSVTGDLTDYDVIVEPVNGIGVRLRYHALVKPYRPGGTAHVALGEGDEFYYTDMSVPRCAVTGTVTAGGRTWEVGGEGYHDHQWMNIHPFAAWHHWLWGRFYGHRYTAVIYDFTASERFGFANVPIFGVMDNTTGEVIFDNRGPAQRETVTYHDDVTGKDYPQKSRYTFRGDDGTAVTFEVERRDIIEFRDVYGDADKGDRYGMSSREQRARYDAMGIQPTYMRYTATATLTITGPDGATHRETGEMIYEFNYPGKPDPRVQL